MLFDHTRQATVFYYNVHRCKNRTRTRRQGADWTDSVLEIWDKMERGTKCGLMEKLDCYEKNEKWTSSQWAWKME